MLCLFWLWSLTQSCFHRCTLEDLRRVRSGVSLRLFTNAANSESMSAPDNLKLNTIPKTAQSEWIPQFQQPCMENVTTFNAFPTNFCKNEQPVLSSYMSARKCNIIHQKREVKGKHVWTSRPHQPVDLHVFSQATGQGPRHFSSRLHRPCEMEVNTTDVFIGLVQFTLCPVCTQAPLNGQLNCQWWVGEREGAGGERKKRWERHG